MPEGYPDYALHKMVTVMRGGEEVKICKRAGDCVTRARPRSTKSGATPCATSSSCARADTELVFDIDLAKSQSDENPVYYVQYAHARVCSVLREWGGDAAALAKRRPLAACVALRATLAQKLAQFPEVLARAARRAFAPHLVTYYLHDDVAARPAYLLQCRAFPRRRRIASQSPASLSSPLHDRCSPAALPSSA